MKLHSSTLEKAMRRLVRAEMRASPALRRARRKQRRARHFSANNVIWRLILTGWFFAVIAAARGRGVSVEGQLAFVTFWAATQVLARAGSLLGALYGSGDLYALFHLPISDTLILRWQCQKFLRSILWTWVEFILGYWLVLGGSKLTVGAWFALIAGAAVQTAMIVILALVLVVLRPSPLYARAAWLIGAAAFAGTVFQSFVASRFFDALQLAAPAVNSFLPGGWVSLLLSPILSNDGNWSSLAFVAPVGVVLASAPFACGRLARSYRLGEAPEMGVHEATGHSESGVAPAGSEPGPTAVLDAINTRAFLDPLPVDSAGLLGRFLARQLDEREMTLLEFLLGQVPDWDGAWKKAGMFAAAGLAGAKAIQQIGPQNGGEGWAAYLFVGGMLALWTVSTGFGCGFAFRFMSGANIPMYAAFPVGYREISRVVFKAALARILAAAPLLIGYGAIAYWWLDKSWFAGALLGLKTAWIALAMQPAASAFRFSSTTNDTQHVRLRELRLLAAVAVAGLLFLSLAAALLFLDEPTAWMCAALLPLPSFGFHWFYGRWFDRNRFDLLQQPA